MKLDRRALERLLSLNDAQLSAVIEKLTQEYGVDLGGLQISTADMAALRRAVDQLEPQQRELLCMVYEEGRSCASIARDDGVSEYAVRDRLYRIHKKLKNFLQ